MQYGAHMFVFKPINSAYVRTTHLYQSTENISMFKLFVLLFNLWLIHALSAVQSYHCYIWHKFR